MKTHHHHDGYVLVTAMIFMLLLTLVALTAIKGSGVELRMSSNHSLRAEALHSSESGRVLLAQLLEQMACNVYDDFDVFGVNGCSSFPSIIGNGLTVRDYDTNSGNGSGNWLLANNPGEVDFLPEQLKEDAYFSKNLAASGSRPYKPRVSLSVYLFNSSVPVGDSNEFAADAGSRKSMAFVYNRSRASEAGLSSGTDPKGQAFYETSAIFRTPIVH
jgi:hypothetical protein